MFLGRLALPQHHSAYAHGCRVCKLMKNDKSIATTKISHFKITLYLFYFLSLKVTISFLSVDSVKNLTVDVLLLQTECLA